MAKCRSCQAPIVWARTVAGRACPIDASPDGEPLIVAGGGLVRIADVDGAPLVRAEHGATGYRSHFASCPNAKTWRKKP